MFSFAPRSAMYDTTPVENMFINEFMPRAEGAFIKVYLYGLMRCYHPEEDASVESMARELNMREDDVLNAFEYWEKMGLVRRTSDARARYAYINVKLAAATREDTDGEVYEYARFNQSLQALFGERRLLRPKDYKKAHEWAESLRLPQEVILRLVQYSIEKRGKGFSFDKLDDTANDLAKRRINTAAEADGYFIVFRAENKGLRQVLERLGRKAAASYDDAEMFLKWIDEWGFSLDAVLSSCKETTKGTPTMAYLDGILKRMHAANLHTAQEIERRRSMEQEERDSARPILEAMGIKAAPNDEWKKAVDTQMKRGFTRETLIIAASYVSRRNGKLDDFERLLDSWHAQGLLNTDAVEAHLAALNDANLAAAKLLRIAGSNRAPNLADRNLIQKWRNAGHSDELVETAAEFSIGAAKPMLMIDKLLGEWKEIGAASVEAARAEHERFLAKKASSAQGVPSAWPANQNLQNQQKNTRPSKEVAEHRYSQRQYKDEELDSLALNLMDDRFDTGMDSAG